MSLWGAVGDFLVDTFAEGKATIRDQAAPAAAAKTVRVVVEDDRAGEDLGVESRGTIVKLSGAALGSMEMTGAKKVTLDGVQYDFNPLPGVGIASPADAMAGKAPIVRGVLTRGGR